MKSTYHIQKPEAEWDGLTLDEIRYARALTRARIEISKEMISARTSALMSGKSAGTESKTMLGRMLGALNWLDYGLIAIRLGSKISSLFRRRKK